MKRFLAPLIVFAVLSIFLAAALSHDPRRLPSALIGKPAPAFDLPQLQTTGARLSSATLRGQVWVLNVWASWCQSCRDEHALLVEFARRNVAPIYGLDYKDEPKAALEWIARSGQSLRCVDRRQDGADGYRLRRVRRARDLRDRQARSNSVPACGAAQRGVTRIEDPAARAATAKRAYR